MVEQLEAAGDDAHAQDVLADLRDRLSRNKALTKTRGYNKALLRDALSGSQAGPREFSQECIETLSSSYNHPPLGGGGCFAYEAPLYFLDTPNPPLLTAANPQINRRYRFGQAGAGGVRIIGLMGTVRRADTGATISNEAVEALIDVNGGGTVLTSNGERQTFINFANWFNSAGTYFPFSRLASSRDFIDVTFRSRAAAAFDLIPNFTFVVGVLPYLSQMVKSARDMIMQALGRYSRGHPDEFDQACMEQLWDMYQERQPGGCTLTFESPTRFFEANTDITDTPAAIPPAGELTRRIVFNQGGGMIIGVMGSVEDNTTNLGADLSNIEVQLSINGGEYLNITGRVRSFTPYNELFPNPVAVASAKQSTPFYPFRRLVTSRDFMDVRWRNVAPGGGPVLIPHFSLAFGRLSNMASSLC